MNILITGGAGFIGSHTADALAEEGHHITILDTVAPPVHDGHWPKYLSKKYRLIKGDVTKREDWLKALKNAEVVYALAAYQDLLPDFSRFFSVNTVGLALMFELIVAKKLPVKKIIFAGSQFSYGDGQYACTHASRGRRTADGEGKKEEVIFYPSFRPLAQLEKGEWEMRCPHGQAAKFLPFREDQILQPPNAYALSKSAKEQVALLFGKRCGIPVVGMRYSIVQGARQSPRNAYSGALRIFATQALAGKPLTVYEDGHQRRDFVNVHDVVAANLLVLKNPAADNRIFNVGGGQPCTVLAFAELVKEITGSVSPIAIDGSFRWGDTRHAVSDIAKIKKLGWRPRSTPADSIKEYAAWLKNEWKDRLNFSAEAIRQMKKLRVVRSVR